MKIICFGNTNNFPFLLIRALRDAGHNAQIIVNQKEKLHRPENLIPAYGEAYPNWIRDYSDIPQIDYVAASPTLVPVLRLLESADALILNDIGPSLLGYVGRPCISFLTGSDLAFLARYESAIDMTRKWAGHFQGTRATAFFQERWRDLIARQRMGIRNSTKVSFFPPGLLPESDTLLNEIGVKDIDRIHLYMADTTLSASSNESVSDEVVLFCGARLTWKRPSPAMSELDYKGTDHLLNGFAKFISKNPIKVRLQLFEKGLHVKETKLLVKDLKLDGHIEWLPEMSRTDFDLRMKAADICIDQLGGGVVGMSGIDAMCAGKPLIANAREDVWYPQLDEAPPICNARDSDGVYRQLEKLIPNRRLRLKVGKASRKYVLRHWNPAINAAKCLEVFGK